MREMKSEIDRMSASCTSEVSGCVWLFGVLDAYASVVKSRGDVANPVKMSYA